MNAPLSDYDVMVAIRLPNWSFCGQQNPQRPDPEGGTATIYQMGRANRDGDGEEAPEAPPPPPDYRDAEWLDILIANKLPRAHRITLSRYYGTFYKKPDRSYAIRTSLPSAVRALLDVEYFAREIGWGK